MKKTITVLTLLITISAQAKLQQGILCKSGLTIESAVNQINATLYDVNLYKGTREKEEGFVRIYSQDTEKHIRTYHDLEVSSVSNPSITRLDGEGFVACILVSGKAK